MSRETSQWLNNNVLVGFTEQRGHAWHYKASEQGEEPNHYTKAIPVEDVRRRLFNWQAQEANVYVKVPLKQDDGNFFGDKEAFKIVDDRKAILRSDNNEILGMFKDSYQIHQYDEWLLNTVANIIDDSNLQIGSAGLLKGGGVAWVSVEMPETIKTKEGFPIRPHLLATTSHNGTLASTFKRVVTAVVCDNTLAGALGEQGSEFKTRHSKYSDSRIQSIRDAIGIVHSMADDVIAQIERLSSITVSQAEWDAIVDRLVPVGMEGDARPQAISRAQNKQEAIRHMYKYDERCAPWQGTALGALNTFNTFYHHATGKDESRVERNALNALNGKTDEFDRQVLEVIKDVVLV
jgi:phage/plasmid-like protein (TIGR03299 family)